MTQPAGRPMSHIQQGPSAQATPPVAPAAPKAAGMSRGWRVALFIWITAFICLVAYELLNTLVRTITVGWGAK